MSKSEEFLQKIITCGAFALAVLASALLLIIGINVKNAGAYISGGVVLGSCLCVGIKWIVKQFKEI